MILNVVLSPTDLCKIRVRWDYINELKPVLLLCTFRLYTMWFLCRKFIKDLQNSLR